MSKIKELINSNDTIMVFDVDGVLALTEWDEYNHNMHDEDWLAAVDSGRQLYTPDLAIDRMKEYIKSKNIDNIYVCSKVPNDNEAAQKVIFLTNEYGIKKDNLYFVKSDDDKLEALNEIKTLYPDIDDHKIAMIDDSRQVLDHILNNSNYSTIHVSSFL